MTGSAITRIDIPAFARRALTGLADEVLLADARVALTGAELLARAASLTHTLQDAGLAPGAPVMMAMGPRVEAVEAFWAVAQAGLTAVPVSPGWARADLDGIRAATGARLAIADAAGLAALGGGFERGLLCGDGGPAPAGWTDYALAATDGGVPEPIVAGDFDPCMLSADIEARGGLRIGVATHRSVALTGGAGTFQTGSVGARLVVAVPMCGPALAVTVWSSVVCGAPVFLVPDDAPAALTEAVAAWRPSAVIAGPALSAAALADAAAAVEAGRFRALSWTVLLAPGEVDRNAPAPSAGLSACERLRVASVVADPIAGLIARRRSGEAAWRPYPMTAFALRTARGVTVQRGMEGGLAVRSPQLCAGLTDRNATARAFADGWYDVGLAGRLTEVGFCPAARDREAAASCLPRGASDADDAVRRATAADIGALLCRGAAFRDRDVALIDGDDRHCYGAVIDRANRLSAALQRRFAVAKGDRVAFLALNRAEFMEAYLATVQIGAVFVPINFRLAAKEAGYILRDAGARLLIAEPEFAPMLDELRREAPCLEAVISLPGQGTQPSDYDDLIGGYPPEPARPEVDDDDPCSLLYTAGTTGFPKGAVRSHKAVLWFGLASSPNSIRTRADGVHLAAPPMFHIAGHETAVVPALMLGAKVVVLRRVEAEAVLELVERHRITSMFVPPTMALALLEVMRRRAFDLSSLADWSSASAPLPSFVREEVLQRIPHVAFRNNLGMTEVGGVSVLEGPRLREKPETCVGRPLPTMKVGIVDAEDRLLARGGTGEIVLRSPQIVEGYWNNAEATGEAMRGGWFHTGDIGLLDEDGYLHLLGRLKDMILTGGENVYAAEVENVLLAMPEIAEAAVVGLPDPKWGEVVTAFVVLKPGHVLDADGLTARCRREIAGYKCPRKVVFADSLPRSPIGKVQKHLLRETRLAGGRG